MIMVIVSLNGASSSFVHTTYVVGSTSDRGTVLKILLATDGYDSLLPRYMVGRDVT